MPEAIGEIAVASSRARVSSTVVCAASRPRPATGWGGQYPTVRRTISSWPRPATATKPLPKATRPSHLPSSTEDRRIGRVSTARAIPDSTSPARVGPARKAVPSAAIRLRPNITRLSTVDAAIRASPLVSEPNSASRRWKPQALRPSSTTVITTRARSTRRRTASCRVSRAMVSTVIGVHHRRAGCPAGAPRG
jgi:hypothetical protein